VRTPLPRCFDVSFVLHIREENYMTISATERLDIIKLVVGTFNAAPGETYLNELVPIVDNGGSMLDVATALTQTDVYKSAAF